MINEAFRSLDKTIQKENHSNATEKKWKKADEEVLACLYGLK